MNPLDIQYALKQAGVSQADIARQCQVSKVTVGYVVSGITTSRRVATAIAEATGLTLETLWPGRYPAADLAAPQALAMGDAA